MAFECVRMTLIGLHFLLIMKNIACHIQIIKQKLQLEPSAVATCHNISEALAECNEIRDFVAEMLIV